MRLRGAGSAGRRRRPLFAIGVAFNTVLISMLMSGLGATPAMAVQPLITREGTNDVTDNVWAKLACNVTLQIGGAIAVAHIGVILRVTHPDSVDPNQVFDLTNVTAVQVLPPTAQHVALATYAPDNFAGVVTDFEIHGTGAQTTFVADPAHNMPPPPQTQINQVSALQPTNADTPNPVDPLINPDTANPAPGQWWTDNGIAASDSRRHNVFSFGAIPTPGGQNPTYALNAYGPSPGTGGGPNATDGTPDNLHIFPVTTTGLAGTNISIPVGKPGTNIVMQDGTGTSEQFAAHAEIFFHETNTPPAHYTVALPVDCGLDTYPETGAGCPAQCGIIVPAPGYCTRRPTPAEPAGFPIGCYTGDDALTPASAKPGISVPIVAPAPRTEHAATSCPGAKCLQYTLSNSNGTTWTDMDTTNLQVEATTATPSGPNQSVLVSANADLFTGNAGFNQDIGIFVSDNGGADQLLAWKESGGFAGVYSPNAATVQFMHTMTAGHTYVYKLKWKTNVGGSSTIYAGAGGAGNYSPTALTAEIFPPGVTPNAAQSTSQYTLSNSDGATWQTIDAANLATTITPASNSTAVLGGNVDLFTGNAGFNQDIGIFVSDNGGADALVSWKESGGFAGVYSPNAAFVKATYAMTAGHSYNFKLKWKTNKPGTSTIYAAAGNVGAYSPTTLVAEVPSAAITSANTYPASTSQYTLNNSDGTTWQVMDAALNATVAGTDYTYARVGANTDLFTANAGYNQDIAIFVSDNGGADQLLAWKESGGFAGIYSPNAAFVHTTLPLATGHTYVFKLKWKTNINAPGTTIYAAAGNVGNYSNTRVTAEVNR